MYQKGALREPTGMGIELITSMIRNRKNYTKVIVYGQTVYSAFHNFRETVSEVRLKFPEFAS